MHYMKNTLKALLITTLLLCTNSLFSNQVHPYYQNSLDYTDEPALRTVLSAAPDGSTLEMNDGTIWIVSSYEDKRELCSWYVSDPIVFLKTSQYWSFFADSNYEIINLAKGCSIKAKLSIGPYSDTFSSYTLHAITSKGHVILKTPAQRHVLFLVSQSQKEENLFSQWLLGDSVLIGRSNINENSTAKDLKSASHVLINLGANKLSTNSIKARYLGFVQYK